MTGTGRTTSWTPTPREGCPERCQGHYAPCEHRTGSTACRRCIEQRRQDGPIWCGAFTEAEGLHLNPSLDMP